MRVAHSYPLQANLEKRCTFYQSGKCRDGKRGLSGNRNPNPNPNPNLGNFLWDTGNTVNTKTVQSGKFSLGYGIHRQYENRSIWEIFFGIRLGIGH